MAITVPLELCHIFSQLHLVFEPFYNGSWVSMHIADKLHTVPCGSVDKNFCRFNLRGIFNVKGDYLFSRLSIAVIRNTFISSTVMATYINKCNCLTFDLLSSVGQFLSQSMPFNSWFWPSFAIARHCHGIAFENLFQAICRVFGYSWWISD